MLNSHGAQSPFSSPQSRLPMSPSLAGNSALLGENAVPRSHDAISWITWTNQGSRNRVAQRMTFRSPLPDVSIPEISLPDFVLANARRRGARPALIDGSTGTTLSFAALATAVERVAGSLVARGLAKGDVCAIYSPNLPEFVIAFLAIASAGGAVTTANPLYTIHELIPQFVDSRVKIVFSTPELAATAMKAAERAGVKEVITFGEKGGATPFAELMRARQRSATSVRQPCRRFGCSSLFERHDRSSQRRDAHPPKSSRKYNSDRCNGTFSRW